MMTENALFGFAEVDITPKYNVQTVGFNRTDNLSQGILHPLVAQISVWRFREETACLIAIDHIGFMREDANQLREAVGNQLGIAREKVMLCFSHTHSAPNVSLEPEYFRFLCRQVLGGVSAAAQNLAPVKAAWGNAKAEIGMNRRDPRGVLDRRIGILKVVDAVTGDLRALILRVTAHANVLYQDNYLISSDFIGVAREALQIRFGCKVMLTQGASGNVKPKFESSPEALDQMAFAITQAVAAGVENLNPHKIEKLTMVSQTQQFYADVPSLERARAIAEEAMRENQIDGTKWLGEVTRLHHLNIAQQSEPIEMQFFIVNQGCFCGVANEIMCELAVEVAESCQDDLIHFGGYTNGCGGYLPTAAEYDCGGYEVLHSNLIYYIYHGRVMPLNRESAEQLVNAVATIWTGYNMDRMMDRK